MSFIERRSFKTVQRFLPEEPGLRAHVLRVATLAARTGDHRGLSAEECETLEHAGLLHHYPLEQTESQSAAKLLAALNLPGDAEFEALPKRATALVRLYRGVPDAPSAAARTDRALTESAALLDSANLFDEQMENLPYETVGAAESIEELFAAGVVSRTFQDAVSSFRVATRQQLQDTIRRLPVFPKAAMEALRMARDPNAGNREIEKAISRDPVLAGEMIHLANSGLFGTWHPVSSLSVALSRVGTIAAGKLIAAAAIRRCFVSANLQSLWSHSFDSGEYAAQIAGEIGSLDTGEAYLAGLVHDVGRLAFELAPSAPEMRRWQEAGFPVTYAEFLVSGTDHAALGAEILRAWRFPDEIAEAVNFHHRPELTASKLAALLYSAESTDEALPSCARAHQAAKRLEVSEIHSLRVAG